MTRSPNPPFLSPYASPNFGERRAGCKPSLILLHYTALPDTETTLRWFQDPARQLNSHYVIGDAGDVHHIVADQARAWHAGVGYWRGERDVNSISIGIELQNIGEPVTPYPDAQMAATIELCHKLIAMHSIHPHAVVGHSDIAPQRKTDPGAHFSWAKLAQAGVGFWPEDDQSLIPTPVRFALDDRHEHIAEAQMLLNEIGYEVDVREVLDAWTANVLRAFQMHWRPARVDGLLDEGTRQRIKLVHKAFLR